MVQKVNIYLNGESGFDYDELEKVLKTATFEVVRAAEKSNPNGMGIDWSSLVVLLPALYPYIVEFRKTLKSYLSYKQSMTKEFSLRLENNGKQIEINGKNIDFTSLDDFLEFFEVTESKKNH